MPNQTLTPSKVFRVTSGWNVIDSTGQEWWIPAEDRQTKQSNQSLADEIQASIGKPIELATWVKDDGSTHAIFGKPKPRQQGGGGFKSMTPEERVAERRSIEAQKAAGIAVAILGSVPDHSFDLEQALSWVCGAIPPIAGVIRHTATLVPVGVSVEAGEPTIRRDAAGSASTPPVGEEPQDQSASPLPRPRAGSTESTTSRQSSPTTSEETGAQKERQGATAPGATSSPVGESAAPPTPEHSSDATPDELNELISACGGSAVAATRLARDMFGVATLRKLTHGQWREVIAEATSTRDEYFENVVTVCGYGPEALTDSLRIRIGKFGREVRETGTRPGFILGFEDIWRRAHPDIPITVGVLANNWGDYMAGNVRPLARGRR